MNRLKPIAYWVVLFSVCCIPILVAALSPLLASRDVPYILGGLAGVVALSLLVIQPVVAAGYLPGIHRIRQNRIHRWTGFALVLAVLLHVVGLYLTSPADVIDVLLLRAPTAFSLYGLAALWGVLLIAVLVALRLKFQRRLLLWKYLHNLLGLVVVVSTVIHALLIDGTMGIWSKWMVCVAAVVVSLVVIVQMRFLRKT